MSGIDFAALLCSRLCHDLVSPVGAMSNGLEILAEEHDDTMREQVMAMLDQSARQTANRLQFFRLAFGAAGGFGDEVDPREAHKALSAFFESSKVVLDWQVSAPSLDKRLIKLLLNVSLLAGESLIRGGDLKVVHDGERGGGRLEVTATGDRVIFSESTRKALLGEMGAGELEPRSAPAFLAAQVAVDLGVAVEVEELEGRGHRFSVQMA